MTAPGLGEGPWTATVLTLFPEMFPGPLAYSLAGKALEAGQWRLQTVDIREFASDKHRTVDDAPFGGGAGLVMRAEVVDRALRATLARGTGDRPRFYLTPRGRRLTQGLVREIASGPGPVMLCGRYEGVDQRAVDAWRLEEVSLGDFVLSGGEPAAIALIDACVRLLPGVMGSEDSLDQESFENGLLEYPHYTRPQEWRGRTVPEVLLSGHHERIRRWRLEQAERVTRQRRGDLWARYVARSGNKGRKAKE
ncbi:MAG: tRNA (guanosine(37)-N1)-methyltransferase TrmD [Kiloniellales bacterium]